MTLLPIFFLLPSYRYTLRNTKSRQLDSYHRSFHVSFSASALLLSMSVSLAFTFFAICEEAYLDSWYPNCMSLKIKVDHL